MKYYIRYTNELVATEEALKKHLLEEDSFEEPLTVQKAEEQQQMLTFVQQRIEKDNQQIDTYTVGPDTILYERKLYRLTEDEVITIHPHTGVMKHEYTDIKGVPQMMELALHEASEDWQLHYELDPHPDIRRDILGYDCYKLVIHEERINKKEGWHDRYRHELFVTDALPLSLSLIIHLWKPVTDLCALEIKTTRLDQPESYHLKQAVKIEEV